MSRHRISELPFFEWLTYLKRVKKGTFWIGFVDVTDNFAFQTFFCIILYNVLNLQCRSAVRKDLEYFTCVNFCKLWNVQTLGKTYYSRYVCKIFVYLFSILSMSGKKTCKQIVNSSEIKVFHLIRHKKLILSAVMLCCSYKDYSQIENTCHIYLNIEFS